MPGPDNSRGPNHPACSPGPMTLSWLLCRRPTSPASALRALTRRRSERGSRGTKREYDLGRGTTFSLYGTADGSGSSWRHGLSLVPDSEFLAIKLRWTFRR
jgi:hypothetical protein